MLGLYASGRGEWLWANLPLSRPWPLLDTKLLHPENYLQLRGSRFPDHVTTFFFPTLGQEILWLMGSNHQLKTAHTISRGMHSGPRPTIPKMGWWTVQDANVTSPILATMRPLTYISSTMWPCDPISEWPGAPQPIWGKKTKHDFRPSSLLHRHDVVCQKKRPPENVYYKKDKECTEVHLRKELARMMQICL